jgi:tetratricopeptide (TPR) repeat protein
MGHPLNFTRQSCFVLQILALALCLGMVPASGRAEAPDAAPAQTRQADPASFIVSGDTVLTVHQDATAEKLVTVRVKILGGSALRSMGQQTLGYHEGSQSLDIVEAYTEKLDGRKIQVNPASIMTRDAASGLALVYLHDLKTRTIIFPDLAIGDAIVFTYRLVEKTTAFPGHFYDMWTFPREVPYGETRVQIVAPKDSPLKVATSGEELERQTVEDGNTIHHLITYHPKLRVFAEPGQTSALDRDPRILISTFRNYEDLGRSWMADSGSHAQVTPEIVALAEEITNGIAGKRAQAEAIDRWVKTNIRYVAVLLNAAAGVVPHETAEILKNRYGDCKDHAALMSALLAAKHIASELVLIEAGNSYTRPELATPAFGNHMIIYLPDFGLYDDPTVSAAAFGVLMWGDYDKPVLRFSASGGHLDRTPPMRADDNTTANRTKITVAADRSITGETAEINTGIFAINSRSTATEMYHSGLEKGAESQLRSNGTPGSGRFEFGSLSDLVDPFVIKGKFTINYRMNTAPNASPAIPFGLAARARAGKVLLGSRYEGRKLPFVCYAGRQVEEIDVTFADGLPLPLAIKGRKIENRLFTYISDYRLDDRTLKVRREFVSRVPGQVCAPEVEAEIATPLRAVQDDLDTRMRMPAVSAASTEPASEGRSQASAEPKPQPRAATPMPSALQAETPADPKTDGQNKVPVEPNSGRPVEPRAEPVPEPHVETGIQRKPTPPTDGLASNWDRCLGVDDALPDLQIHGCTAVIQSGLGTSRMLVLAFTNRGFAHRTKGDYDRAIQDFGQAIRLAPNHAPAFNGRGMAWQSKGEADRAIADFDEAIRLNPKFARAFANRGSVYTVNAEHQRAKQDFDQAIGLDSTLAFAFVGRGRIHRSTGDYVRALQDFEHATRLQPKNAAAWNGRCYTHAVVGRLLQMALAECNQSLMLQPNNSHALDSRGFTYLKLGELDRAIADYDAALRLDPKALHSLYGRGVARLKRGDIGGGNADIAAAKSIDPAIAEEFTKYGVTAATAITNTPRLVNEMREAIVTENGLEGTFVRPGGDGPFPAVLIIAGSGPTDRDGNNNLGLMPASYRKLADALAVAGVASLRYDKRLVGKSADPKLHESDVHFGTFIDDAANWAGWLSRQPGVGSVFLAGHSEGALIASAAAKRVQVAGVVLLTGAGRRIGYVLRSQLAAGPMPETLRAEAAKILAELEAGRKVDTVNPPLFAIFRPSVQPFLISWLSLDPAEEIRNIKAPVLIVWGRRDLQVAEADFQALARARPDAELLVIDTMNHVLKDVGEGREANQLGYSDPALPLAHGLTERIVTFIVRHQAT